MEKRERIQLQMKVYLVIRLSNDLYVENVVLGVCKSKESAIKLAAMCDDYEIKEYEVIEC